MAGDFVSNRRVHRLPEEQYLGRVLVSFTVCEGNRTPLLAEHAIFDAFRGHLGVASELHGCRLPTFVLMPDHAHILALGESETSNAKAMMDKFKALSGAWLYRHRPNLKWQPNYFDHIVRSHESAQQHLRYLAANPCRAGLAEDVYSWPFSDSIGHDFRETIQDAFWD